MVIGLRWPDFGRTAALNVAAYYALVDGIPPGQRAYVPVGEMPETLYGSDRQVPAPTDVELTTKVDHNKTRQSRSQTD